MSEGNLRLLCGEEEHEHCIECDCILRWDESKNYCRWCEDRMAKEKEIN